MWMSSFGGVLIGCFLVGLAGLVRPRPFWLLTLLLLEGVVCVCFGLLLSLCMTMGDVACGLLGVVLLGTAAAETAVGLGVLLSTSGA